MKGKKSKKAATAAAQVDKIEDVTEVIFRESLDAILTEIRGIKTGAIKPTEHDPTSRIAWLAQKAAAVGAELRKGEAAEIKRIGALRYEDVMAYLRQLPREQRAGMLRDIASFDAEGSVLA